GGSAPAAFSALGSSCSSSLSAGHSSATRAENDGGPLSTTAGAEAAPVVLLFPANRLASVSSRPGTSATTRYNSYPPACYGSTRDSSFSASPPTPAVARAVWRLLPENGPLATAYPSIGFRPWNLTPARIRSRSCSASPSSQAARARPSASSSPIVRSARSNSSTSSSRASSARSPPSTPTPTAPDT